MNYSDAAGIVAQNLHVFWRIRSDLRFEKQLTEERRKQNEINMVRLAMAASENAILNMLQSEMGQTFIIAIAKKLYNLLLPLFEISSKAESVNLDTRIILLIENIPDEVQEAISKFDPPLMSAEDLNFLLLLVQKDLRILLLSEQSHESGKPMVRLVHDKKAKDLKYYAQTILYDVLNLMKKEEEDSTIFISLRKKGKATKNHDIKMIKRIESYLCQHIVSFKVDQCREKAIITNQKIRKVLSGWMGMSLETAFKKWQKRTKARIKQRKKDAERKEKEKLFEEGDQALQLANAKKEFAKWIKKWDKFSDRYYWIHEESRITTWTEPAFDQVNSSTLFL